jgi:hypothetical protein
VNDTAPAESPEPETGSGRSPSAADPAALFLRDTDGMPLSAYRDPAAATAGQWLPYVALTSDDIAHLCSRVTAGQAMLAATRMLGAPLAQSIELPRHGPNTNRFATRHLVSFATGPDVYAFVETTNLNEDDWNAALGGRLRRTRTTHEIRLPLLLDILSIGYRPYFTFNGALIRPYADHLSWTMWAIAVLPLWWDIRIRQGHSPASARTLLALALDPAAASRLDFPADGGAPMPREVDPEWVITSHRPPR